MLKMIVWHQFPALNGYILHDYVDNFNLFPPKTISPTFPESYHAYSPIKPICRCFYR